MILGERTKVEKNEFNLKYPMSENRNFFFFFCVINQTVLVYKVEKFKHFRKKILKRLDL